MGLEVARQQIDTETAPPVPPSAGTSTSSEAPIERVQPFAESPVPPQPPKPKRYHGTVVLDSARVRRDGRRIAEEVIAHLVGLVGSNVEITLEIDADIPAGVPDHVVRTVTENSRTLKFENNSGFEGE